MRLTLWSRCSASLEPQPSPKHRPRPARPVSGETRPGLPRVPRRGHAAAPCRDGMASDLCPIAAGRASIRTAVAGRSAGSGWRAPLRRPSRCGGAAHTVLLLGLDVYFRIPGLLAAQFNLASWSASTRLSTSRAVSSQDRATLTMICRSLGFVACSAHSRQVRQNCITLSFFHHGCRPHAQFGRAAQTHKLFKRCDIGTTRVARPYVCGATSCPPRGSWC